MTPARSLAASVVALGFAGAITAPQPALAAPTPCERAENYAAQSGAEILRIKRLEVDAPATRSQEKAEDPAQVLSGGADSVIPNPEDSDTPSEAIGMTGMGVLGYLGVAPKPKNKTGGVDDELPPPKGGPVRDLAEQGGQMVGGWTGGAGGGEPAEEEQGAGGAQDDDGRVTDKRAKSAELAEIGVGEVRTAMIAYARAASAAYARMLDGRSGNPALAKPLVQQAPPTNETGTERSTPASKAGPLRLGDGGLSTHAQWDEGMACGRVAGEAGRAGAALTSLSLLGSGRGALVRVPGTVTSAGTTAVEHHNDQVRTVARSTITVGRIELAGGKVTVRVLRAPTLEVAMSAAAGGKVNYRPAIVEVSGDGLPTKRLQAAGEHVDFALTPNQRAMEAAPLTELGGLGRAGALPVPRIPGLPPIAGAEPESATLPAKGTRVRVSLGDVRHAVKGQAIAARADSIKVALSQASGSKKSGHDGYSKTGVSLSMSLGVLEAAAISPGAPEVPSGGAGGGGLPVTGPRLDRVAMTGGGLLLAGVVVVLLSLRRRRSHS